MAAQFQLNFDNESPVVTADIFDFEGEFDITIPFEQELFALQPPIQQLHDSQTQQLEQEPEPVEQIQPLEPAFSQFSQFPQLSQPQIPQYQYTQFPQLPPSPTVELNQIWSLIGIPPLSDSRVLQFDVSVQPNLVFTTTEISVSNNDCDSSPQQQQQSPQSSPPTSPSARFHPYQPNNGGSSAPPKSSKRAPSPKSSTADRSEVNNTRDFKRAFKNLLKKEDDGMKVRWEELKAQRKCTIARAPCMKVYREFCMENGGALQQLYVIDKFAKLGTQTKCECKAHLFFYN